MRLIINDILTECDKTAIINGENNIDDIPFFDLSDIKSIYETLSERNKHFFDCLSWLIRNDRIEIKIISPKNSIGISHTKSGIFSDGLNTIGFDGSCNFSKAALIDNIESLTASCDWDGIIEKAKIDVIKKDFEQVFSEQDLNVSYISAENIKTQIINITNNKSLLDLLEAEYEIIKKDSKVENSPFVEKALCKAKDKVEAIIEKINQKEDYKPLYEESIPTFPYSSGPRDYQKLAFENWKQNKQKGLFAMATGTGKTITSLNCLLEIYKSNGYYKALILVPTITLLEQWEKECLKFKFSNIIKVCSKYSNKWKKSLANIQMIEASNPENKTSYIIISTYASFIKSDNFIDLNLLPKKKLLLIADEAHNMGSGRIISRLSEIKYLRRIGLSATPERQFDETGNNRLMEFFGCTQSYTFEYSMREAIENNALCRYYYYPHIVKLTSNEMEKYIELSLKIAKVFNKEDNDSKELLKTLLLIRKQIIHKAENKKIIFKNILKDYFTKQRELKYTLVYVPEGNRPDDQSADIFDEYDVYSDDEDTKHLIDEYTSIVRDLDSHITVRQFTSESKDRDEMLKGFADGNINVLTSMKCLDEGVDVPRSELAIFCASTGNPRQFIQRRGRVLRTHKDKQNAIIHDLIVVPDNVFNEDCFRLEKSLIENELKRVRDFALLSENLNDTVNELQDVLNKYNLSIFN